MADLSESSGLDRVQAPSQPTIWPLVAQFLLDNKEIGAGAPPHFWGPKFSAITLLLLSKNIHRQCTAIIYGNVCLTSYPALKFARGVLDDPDDDATTKERKRAYRQATINITLKELPEIPTSNFWKSGLDRLSDPSNQVQMFPSLKIVKLGSVYVKQLVLFLEINAPRHSSRPSSNCHHPFTAVLVRLCKDRPVVEIAIGANGVGEWSERHFKDVVQSRMWEIDTRINIPPKGSIKLSTIDRAWDRVARVGNSWAIDEIKRIPERSLKLRHRQINSLAIN